MFHPPPSCAEPVTEGTIGDIQSSGDFAAGDPGRIEPVELLDGYCRGQTGRSCWDAKRVKFTVASMAWHSFNGRPKAIEDPSLDAFQ
jgi:hypothetical protein